MGNHGGLTRKGSPTGSQLDAGVIFGSSGFAHRDSTGLDTRTQPHTSTNTAPVPPPKDQGQGDGVATRPAGGQGGQDQPQAALEESRALAGQEQRLVLKQARPCIGLAPPPPSPRPRPRCTRWLLLALRARKRLCPSFPRKIPPTSSPNTLPLHTHHTGEHAFCEHPHLCPPGRGRHQGRHGCGTQRCSNCAVEGLCVLWFLWVAWFCWGVPFCPSVPRTPSFLFTLHDSLTSTLPWT